MAKYRIPYPGLSESLKHLKKQVVHSLPYVAKNLPRFNSPEEVFNFCKSKYHFKSDPKGVELFQTVPTLLENNYHNDPGAGDCDDATIFCLSILILNGFNCGYVLAGRNKNIPTHIYAYVEENGQKKNLDLTNENYNQIRPYPFKQFIPLIIPKNQIKMFLELADNKPRAYRVKRLTPQQKHAGSFFLPSKNVHIPVEAFDRIPEHRVKHTLLSEGYDDQQLSEYLSGRAERKERKALKMEKKRAKIERIRAKNEIKKAKASKKIAKGEASKTRAEAKRLKSEKGGGMKLFNRDGGFIKNLISPDEENPDEENPDEENTDQTDQTDETSPEEENTDQTDDTELNDSGTNTLINVGVFAVAFFLEKTNRV